MRVRFKVWLEKDGKPVISEGKYRLLREVEKTGSIRRASENLGLTYKRAFSQIKGMEERLGYRVLERRRGKGAVLTEEGRRLLEEYERVLKVFKEVSLRV